MNTILNIQQVYKMEGFLQIINDLQDVFSTVGVSPDIVDRVITPDRGGRVAEYRQELCFREHRPEKLPPTRNR